MQLCFDAVFDGIHLHPGATVTCDGGVLTGMTTKIVPSLTRMSGILCPGFIDLQVNGGGGKLLNNTPTFDAMAAIATTHRRFGTKAIMPTLITDVAGKLDQAAQAALHARDMDWFAGLHIEGPHIDPAKRGTHAAQLIHPMSDHTIAVITGLRAADVPVMITLAPEAVTTDQIAQLRQMGAVVSLGHSNAPYEAANAALAAGAQSFTHLFNAMSQMEGRAPGMVGAALSSEAYVGIICDGVHVNDDMIGLALRAKALAKRCFLISDAMATVGGPDTFQLYGKTIQQRDGKLVNADGALAGAHTTVARSVRRLVSHIGVDPEVALQMVTHVPATLMRQSSRSDLMGQPIKDMIILSKDYEFKAFLGEMLNGQATI